MPRALMSDSAARDRDATYDKRREERELELADRAQKRVGGAGHEDEDARALRTGGGALFDDDSDSDERDERD